MHIMERAFQAASSSVRTRSWEPAWSPQTTPQPDVFLGRGPPVREPHEAGRGADRVHGHSYTSDHYGSDCPRPFGAAIAGTAGIEAAPTRNTLHTGGHDQEVCSVGVYRRGSTAVQNELRACGGDQSAPPGAVAIRTGLGERLNGGSGAAPLRRHADLPALYLWTTASLKRRTGLEPDCRLGRLNVHPFISDCLQRSWNGQSQGPWWPGAPWRGGPQSGPSVWAPSLGP
ncbi:unnamed protein product [Arctogadus glacialis]